MSQRPSHHLRLALAATVALATLGAGCDAGPEAAAPDAQIAPPPAAAAARPDAASAAPQRVVDGPAPRPTGLPSRPLVTELDISAARAVFEDARRSVARDERDEAVRLYQQAVTIDPEHHLAWAELFDLLRAEGAARAEEAADACAGLLAARSVTGHPGAQQNLQCAVAHLEAERLEQAEEYARAAVELGDGRLEPLITLSAIQLQRGDYQGVVELLADRIRSQGGPEEASALANLGTAHARLGQLDQAIDAYRQAVELDPTRPDLLVTLYDACSAAGRPEEAAAALEQARALAPDDPLVRSRSGP